MYSSKFEGKSRSRNRESSVFGNLKQNIHMTSVNSHVNPFEVSFDNCTDPLNNEPEEEPVQSYDEYNDETYYYSEDYDSEAYADFDRFLGDPDGESPLVTTETLDQPESDKSY